MRQLLQYCRIIRILGWLKDLVTNTPPPLYQKINLSEIYKQSPFPYFKYWSLKIIPPYTNLINFTIFCAKRAPVTIRLYTYCWSNQVLEFRHLHLMIRLCRIQQLLLRDMDLWYTDAWYKKGENIHQYIHTYWHFTAYIFIPSWIHPHAVGFFKRDNLRHWIFPSLKFTCWQ